MRRLLQEIVIPGYITHITMSNARRAIYYNITGKRKPPQKLLNSTLYTVDRQGFLRVRATGDKVVANKRVVGKPKLQKINGQDFYSGFGSEHLRIKIVAGIKNAFRPFVKHLPQIVEFPIQMEMELHTFVGEGNWDLDNLWIYTKCFQDLLVECGIIPDDNVQFITKPASPEFWPTVSESDRKIVFKIYKDERLLQIQEPVRKK